MPEFAVLQLASMTGQCMLFAVWQSAATCNNCLRVVRH